jgi:hypothetical protein
VPEGPPNYRPADGYPRCANCDAFDSDRSYCSMFALVVEAEWVCDAWEAVEGRSAVGVAYWQNKEHRAHRTHAVR